MEKIELFRSRFLLFLSFRFCFAQSVCDVPTADLWGSEGIHSFGALHGRFTASLEWPKIMRMPPGNRHRIANSISRICTDCDVSEFTRFDQIWDMGAHPALYLRQSVGRARLIEIISRCRSGFSHDEPKCEKRSHNHFCLASWFIRFHCLHLFTICFCLRSPCTS